MSVRVSESSAPQLSGSNSGQTSPVVCSLLRAGQIFSGAQFDTPTRFCKRLVHILGCYLERGYLCGAMKTCIPTDGPCVTTFWEGEIVDSKNYTFFTGKWDASQEDDMRYWKMFPAFGPLQSQVVVDGGKSLDLSNCEHIFMRWKEQLVVNRRIDSGLTLEGFYYVCFSCIGDCIHCHFFRKNMSSHGFSLEATNYPGRTGFTYPSYELQ